MMIRSSLGSRLRNSAPARLIRAPTSAANHAPDSCQRLIDVCGIRANSKPEAKAVAAVIAVHMDFGKLCLNLASTPGLKSKKIAAFGVSAPWRNQIRKPQSLDVLDLKPLDEQRH
jgi:hypothetical protein